MRPAVFLDRDGVINEDRGYVSCVEDFVLLPTVVSALKDFQNAGYLLIVVTNQSGIARGFFDETVLAQLHDHLRGLLAESGVTLDAIYHCPHHIGGVVKEFSITCNCRKPKPGLIQRALADFHVDRARSFIVGDKESDLEAGRVEGIGTGFLVGGNTGETLASVKGRILA